VTRIAVTADVLWTGARHQMAIVRAHPLFLMIGVLQPAVLLLVMFARGGPSGADVTAVATAVLLMAYWSSTVWQGAAVLVRDRNSGTLGALMRGVRDPLLVLTGKSLGASLAPAALTAVTVTATLAALGETPVIADWGWFVAGLAAALLSGTALGAVLCTVLLLTRFASQILSALLYPVFLLAGLLIPADFFPPAISWLGTLVSLRWAQAFLVSAASGAPDYGALGLVGLLTAGYALAGVLAFRRIDTLARRRGTLELG